MQRPARRRSFDRRGDGGRGERRAICSPRGFSRWSWKRLRTTNKARRGERVARQPARGLDRPSCEIAPPLESDRGSKRADPKMERSSRVVTLLTLGDPRIDPRIAAHCRCLASRTIPAPCRTWINVFWATILLPRSTCPEIPAPCRHVATTAVLSMLIVRPAASHFAPRSREVRFGVPRGLFWADENKGRADP